ncbi:hypothetical protein V8E36_002445 [Tilletia maclaganii]
MTAENDDAMSSKRFSILALPLLESTARLTTNLIPDPCTPAPRSLIAKADEPSHPSFLRRARPVTQGAHFSFVTPLPIDFPYQIPVSDVTKDADGKLVSDEERSRLRMVQMEEHIKRWDISTEDLKAGDPSSSDTLRLFVPKARNETPPFAPFRLLGLSPSALPQLNNGDAREFILAHSSTPSSSQSASSGPGVSTPPVDSDAYKRWALSEVLSGRGIAARLKASDASDDTPGVGVEHLKWQEERAAQRKTEDGPSATAADLARTLERVEKVASRQRSAQEGYELDVLPWAQAYAGHQFGEWAGQLGDGRATSLFEVGVPTPINSTTAFPRAHLGPQPSRTDIQLKGAGRTPYSRFADGLATLQSSIREFLCAEYMGGGLGIESCRGLAVGVFTKPFGTDGAEDAKEDGVQVQRERLHPAAVMTRLAPSWVRIGSFELHASRGEWESVRVVGEYAARHLFQWDLTQSDGGGTQPWALRMANEVATRNARTIARWQVAGFMHGVMNTDNIALLGHTIDYGPYGFMDLFDEDCICNHSDSSGRYSYPMQPSMGLFAIQHFVLSLSPLIGFEERHGRAPNAGELAKLGEEALKELSDAGEEKAKNSVRNLYMRVLKEEWIQRWLGRLGLSDLAAKSGSASADDQEDRSEKWQKELIDPLLVVLERLDFSIHLRRLAAFPAKLAAEHAEAGAEGATAGIAKAFVNDWIDETHVLSFEKEGKREAAARWLEKYAEFLKEQGTDLAEVEQRMLKTNPRFVLRNWVTNEVVERVEKKNDTAFLDRVLQMCLDPFREWGTTEAGKASEIVDEENRLCTVGTPLEGHLPSCSS